MESRVCFIGHRKIKVTTALITELTQTIESLLAGGSTIFNFGSRSQFNDLCYQIVTRLRQQYAQIKRVHYCVKYENYTAAGINNLYEQEIDVGVNDGYQIDHARAYLVRNFAMIDHSDICVFYYDPLYVPVNRRRSRVNTATPQSGTALAYAYARKKQKQLRNLKA